MRLSSKNSIDQSKQAGVTLLLAILILSSVLAVSVSLATILFAEVRTSGDLIRTEPALYAANGITEEALFNVRRSTGISSYSSSIGNITTTSTVSSISDAVIQDKITLSSNSFANTQNVYLLYDPANAFAGGGYGRIKVTVLDTGTSGNVNIYLCQFDPLDTNADCTNPSNSTYMVFRNTNPAPMTPGSVWDSSIHCGCLIDSTKQQQLVIYQTSSSNDMYVQIETYDASGVPKGMPYFGETAVNIQANNSSVARKLRVVIPGTIGVGAGNTNSVSVEGSNDYASTLFNGSALSQMTISFWFRISATPSTQVGIFHWGRIGQPLDSLTAALVALDTNRRLRFYASQTYVNGPIINLDTWTHVAMTKTSSNNWVFYVNVAALGTGVTGNLLQSNARTIYVGSGYNGYFNGLVDDFRVWDIALSQAQISSSMNAELTGSESNLIGYWKFNEGTGIVTLDSSPSGNSMNLNNSAGWSTNVPF